MIPFLKIYLSVLIPFAVIDGAWIGFVARGFYARHIGFLINTFNPISAGLFYAFYAAGLSYFVARPMIGEPLPKLFLAGAFFGLVAYASYDFTNQATIREWPVIVTIADLAWGAFATGAAATIAAFLTR